MALDTHAKWVIIFPFSLADFINCSKVKSWRFIDSAAHILTGIGCVRKRAGPSRNLYLRVPETLLYFLEEAGVCIEKKTNKLRLEVITVVDQKQLIFLVSIVASHDRKRFGNTKAFAREMIYAKINDPQKMRGKS